MSERIFEPLVERIKAAGGKIQGGQLVSRVEVDPATGAANRVVARDRKGQETVYDADSVIFSVGVTGTAASRVPSRLVFSCGAITDGSMVGAGMQKVVAASPVLASRAEFAAINNLRGIDVIATRLWFDRCGGHARAFMLMCGWFAALIHLMHSGRQFHHLLALRMQTGTHALRCKRALRD